MHNPVEVTNKINKANLIFGIYIGNWLRLLIFSELNKNKALCTHLSAIAILSHKLSHRL